ncbi:hypothetical protein GCM10022222_20180 [Amycolatopsis ultiminotia]|uniref:Uncharacterized protein n=1 Tax=Amycolatopsis ultiminotia TaxID=543629 RepID=A0ABP6VNS4_9PSEU
MADETERLRAVLHETPPERFAEPDLTRIMADGKRLRRRRRVLSGTGAAAAVVAVLAVVFGTVWLRSPGPAPQQVPAAAPPGTTAPSMVTSTPAPPTPQNSVPAGGVLDTGIRAEDGQLVFYLAKLDQPPGATFGVMAGVRTADRLRPLYLANEIKGSDRSFGFHATSGGMTVGTTWVPVFGYFSGPADRVTTTVGGRVIAAHAGKLSEDPEVLVFWFDQAEVPSAARLTPLTAYTAAGKRLTR